MTLMFLSQLEKQGMAANLVHLINSQLYRGTYSKSLFQNNLIKYKTNSEGHHRVNSRFELFENKAQKFLCYFEFDFIAKSLSD